ncbi:MAG: type IV toxin-antitoxin system AbiEi family antitoxin domain-containing protein [Nocardioides sp.]|nr:type IV toxin-antitoxin system AbiEi family antitoxin domain-containing protein [Nocardioides sp.]
MFRCAFQTDGSTAHLIQAAIHRRSEARFVPRASRGNHAAMMRPPAEWPPDDPRLTPVLLRKELIAAGYNDRAIKRLVDGGVLDKIKRGAYADAVKRALLDAVGNYALRNRAAVKQAKTGVVLSHVSAVPEYDAPTWGLDLSITHLTRLDGKAGRKEAGIQQHCGTIQPGDVVTRNGVQVMAPARAGLEVTTVTSVEAGLIFVCHLLHHELTTIDELVKRYSSMEHWPNTLHTDIVLRLARPELESVGEVRTFYLCYRHAIPMPEPQYKVRNACGDVVARLDFAWPELGVWLEFDGKVKYEKLLRDGERASDVVVREKERESMIGRLTGWRCLRITWADLEHPERTAARIMAFLAGTDA